MTNWTEGTTEITEMDEAEALCMDCEHEGTGAICVRCFRRALAEAERAAYERAAMVAVNYDVTAEDGKFSYAAHRAVGRVADRIRALAAEPAKPETER